MLMVLIPADTFDVVPRVGLMAHVTLIHLRVRLFRNLLRNHLEVFHVMARRRLVTLSAIGRAR